MTISTKEPTMNAEPKFSEYAEKLIDYSKRYHQERPTASPARCLEMGAGRLVGEYGDDKEHLANIALSEVAAQWVFGR